MSLLKVAAVFALVVAASARPDSVGHGAPPAHGGYGPPSPPSYGTHEPQYEKPSYAFEWVVKDDYSGNDYGHQEKRDGYNTEGSYHVLLPDGRVEKVTYTVTKDGGYVATVEFEGEVKHDKQYGKPPAPVYTQPPTYTPPPTPGYGHA